MSHPTFATGEQFEIVRGDSRAVITELAACLRLFEKNSVQLTETFGDDQIPPGAVGILLAPWPNRLGDGRFEAAAETERGYGGSAMVVHPEP